MLDHGHGEIAPPISNSLEQWYLPIFGVYHKKKTSQIRILFDSSATYKGVSLNSALLTGPDLTSSLLSILIRFRKERVAFVADIQQMFHCFFVTEEHRNFLRFLWHSENDPDKPLTEYRMKVHTFGNAPSPAIATVGLRKSVEINKDRYGEDVYDFVNNNFYVDDGLNSEITMPCLKLTG
ncbi:uncharacterized protein [Argopecten irradians]|uniref:uncharacterized protein n=1 Tax=Argopecten irradians TaxID=31199 RepID=UPI00371643A6